MRGSRLRALAAKLGLLAAGLALGLLAAEVVVRLSGAARPAELSNLFDRPEVEFSRAPARRYPWFERKRDNLRIAVVGDSFTVGDGVQPDDAYPARLERLLNMNEEATPAFVQIFAASGSATQRQRGLLLRALRQRPQLVILGIVLNDTETEEDPDLMRRRELTLPRVPTGRTLTALRWSHALRLGYHKMEQARAGRALLEYYRDNFDPGYIGWTRFEEALGYFADRCRKREVELLAVVFPGIFELDPEAYPFHYAHERIAAALDAKSIAHLDLLDAYLGKSELRLAAQPALDGHPNEIGHRIAAEAIFEHLLATGLIEPDYRPASQKPLPREQALRAARRLRTPTALAE